MIIIIVVLFLIYCVFKIIKSINKNETIPEYKSSNYRIYNKIKTSSIIDTDFDIINEEQKWKNEEICRNIFEELTGKKFYKVWHNKIINPKTKYRLQLDGYCPELKLAFEYNGEQHYIPVDHFGYDEKKVKDQQERDLFKLNRCKELGIKLIVIPYYIKDKMEYIKEKLYE